MVWKTHYIENVDGEINPKYANSLERTLSNLEKNGMDPEFITKVREKGILDGSIPLTPDNAETILERSKRIVAKDTTSELGALLGRIDVEKYPSIYAAALFLNPEVREQYKAIENLYKVALNVASKRKGHFNLPSSVRGRSEDDSGETLDDSLETEYVPNNGDYNLPSSVRGRSEEDSKEMLGSDLEEIILHAPEEIFAEEESNLNPEQVAFRSLAKRYAEMEVFPLFAENETAAFELLGRKIETEKNPTLNAVYRELSDTFRQYASFEGRDVNEHFQNPTTGETNALTSLHQRIALREIVDRKKLGVFDGCGTGKTAIAVLAQPLIKERVEAEGKTFGKTLVVCPNSAKKAWKKGLVEDESKRYLKEKQKIRVLNGETKDENLLDSLRESDWIITNYEQLITQMNGSDKLFAEELIDLGVDYVVFDESHHIKNPKGKISKVAQKLANQAEYLTLLSGTPIPDTLEDYAVPFHLLNGDICSSPADFADLYGNNPRVLWNFFNENSLRRTSEDINSHLEAEEIYEDIELDPVQRELYNFIVNKKSPVSNWQNQARKCLLDPRLVDPLVLKDAGLLGKVSFENSAKYQRLEEILTSEDGPLQNGEKFVIFSSMYKQGVTSEHEDLEKRYLELGLSDLFEKLEFNKTLGEKLEEMLEGSDISIGVIDGNVPDIEERERIVDGLNDGLEGIICTTKTGGESLDFTEANHAIFLDVGYSPVTTDQALARIVRQGQKKKVKITYLNGKETLDASILDYVDRKRLIIQMATDGLPLTKEELDFLDDSQGKRFTDMVRRDYGVGGKSTNLTETELDLIDFETKIKTKRSRKNSERFNLGGESTIAQEISQEIGMDRLGIWKDPAFAKKYADNQEELAPTLVNRSRVIDTVKRAIEGNVDFPKWILSEGAGPSMLYSAYQNLEGLIDSNGFEMPQIVDRDNSIEMLKHGKNPNRIIGNMTGERSSLVEGSFDLVDNASLHLLSSEEDIMNSLVEANRVLRDGGTLYLSENGQKFGKDFFSGLSDLGFEVITKKNLGIAPTKQLLKKLRNDRGSLVAGAYNSKLGDNYVVVAKKVGKPIETEASKFRLELIEALDETEENGKSSTSNGSGNVWDELTEDEQVMRARKAMLRRARKNNITQGSDLK
ncbi:DEAD/DEAH box helicase family protein [Candidatus Woesearchaeota archaeon]|nr:DEAD/DEAH box helicase family protein [Candidatus Woesearchaeota archaeon]